MVGYDAKVVEKNEEQNPEQFKHSGKNVESEKVKS
jgi:hypothetical protein